MKPMMAQIIPIIPQANCLLIMAIIPNKSERGTNIGAQKNMLMNQKLKYSSHKTTKEKLMAFLHDQSRINKSKEFTIS